MGLFKKLFGNEPAVEQSIIEQSIFNPISFIDKLRDEIGIDFYGMENIVGEEKEIGLDEELQGIIKRKYIFFEGKYFNFAIFSTYNSGKYSLFLIKSNSNERDFKDFIDSLYKVLGEDWKGRAEFKSYDLLKIRGDINLQEGLTNQELRAWKDPSTDYVIRVCFTEVDKNLLLNITEGILYSGHSYLED